ncbi:hypothetical protein KHC33_13270 [Methanospirillum sp. J.3.6.1-F.2.7.3]|uniref:Uncharacterized protein n=1 Tax=Methanospirillum purgamenti TaxID=2834276 RepID=A0A8E7EGK9_9EURY|nr:MULTISPECIES: hypothetical protein [Methanospirillum]MDX8550552.1 hypothetical protein [Methanospirillum hungatei]QVV88288.1 hypothetical protein KHC33_13270 [Methanospirillum sp. J.3.6.1-F.2.7.3]
MEPESRVYHHRTDILDHGKRRGRDKEGADIISKDSHIWSDRHSGDGD